MSKANIHYEFVTEDLKGVVHAIWECEDCDWKQDGYMMLDDGENKAYEHATTLGHAVHGEIVTMRKILGKKK